MLHAFGPLEVTVQLLQSGPSNPHHVFEGVAPQQLLLKGLYGGGDAEALPDPDDVGDVVQNEGTDGQIGDILVWAIAPGALAGTVVDGRPGAVCPHPVLRGPHEASAVTAGDQAGEDMHISPVEAPTVAGLHGAVSAWCLRPGSTVHA